MAKITKEETRICTTAEAVSLVKNADGRVRFGVHVKAFLPTTEGRGFESGTGLTISRSDMLKVINDVCNDKFEERGARIELKLSPPRYEGASSWIWLS
jgi:hypothetical protein